MSITLEEAQKAIDVAMAKCKSMGLRMAFVVVDAHGDLVASVRMDGVRSYVPEVARGKAMASAIFGQPSGALAERASTPVFQAVSRLNGERLVYHQGAVPIMRGNELIGAIGAGGAQAAQDEEAVKAGAAALTVPVASS